MKVFPQVFPMLESSRLILCNISRDDAHDLFAIYGDPEVMRFTDELPFPELRTVDTMLASMQRLFDSQIALEWAVKLKDGGRVIGTIGLHSFDVQEGSAEVGCLLSRSSWGYGYMREAVSCLMSYAANSLDIRRLHADVHPENVRAVRLFPALGFVPVPGGVLERAISNLQ